MTDISVTKTDFQVENRGWLHGSHGAEPGANPSITLDISAFTEATHFPKGYIPSGTAVVKLDSGMYGPHSGDTQPAGLLFSTVAVRRGATKVGGALFVHGFVNPDRLPVKLSETAQSGLPLIHFGA